MGPATSSHNSFHGLLVLCSLPVPLSSRMVPTATPDLKCCQRTFLAAVWMAGSPIRWESWRGFSRPSIAGMNRDELFCFLENGNSIQLNSVGSRQLLDYSSGCSVTTWHIWGPGKDAASHQMLCPATLCQLQGSFGGSHGGVPARDDLASHSWHSATFSHVCSPGREEGGREGGERKKEGRKRKQIILRFSLLLCYSVIFTKQTLCLKTQTHVLLGTNSMKGSPVGIAPTAEG